MDGFEPTMLFGAFDGRYTVPSPLYLSIGGRDGMRIYYQCAGDSLEPQASVLAGEPWRRDP